MKLIHSLLTPRGLKLSLVSQCVFAALLAGCGGGSVDEPSQHTAAPAEDAVEEDRAAAQGGAAQADAPQPVANTASNDERRSAQAVVADTSHLYGKFGPLSTDWPIIPIATMLTPDGRVLAYGTDTDGNQGAKAWYVVWDPTKGMGPDAFMTLPNTTATDIFCAAQALIPQSSPVPGGALLLGGEASLNGIKNYANNGVTLFNPANNSLTADPRTMAFKRWYPTAVTMPNGEHLVLGGRIDNKYDGPLAPPTVATYASTPEVRSVAGDWRTLSTAASDYAYGPIGSSWNYPRAWVNPQGKVYILAHNGNAYQLDTAGTGTVTKYPTKTDNSDPWYTSIMYAPGKILSVRRDRKAVTINLNVPAGTEPTIAAAGLLVKDRKYGTATVLADGSVWVNGGSSSTTPNSYDPLKPDELALQSELWSPTAPTTWKPMATATQGRLYHSVSMLLPDATVFTGGGGAPGPWTQKNGEIYYPTYLFKKDGSGAFAPRPNITYAPTTSLGWNQAFSISADKNIARVTLVRVGGITHAYNNETKFFTLGVTAGLNTTTVSVKTPASNRVAPPGYYMVYVWSAGVPSVAKILKIG